MRYLYIFILLALPLIYSCNEDSNSNNGDIGTSCFTPEELFASDCPTELLSNMCSTLSCSYNVGDLALDGFFPSCPMDYNCSAIDCNTLNCGQILYDISTGESGLSYSFDTIDPSTGFPIEVRVPCIEGGQFSFTCEEEGMTLN